MIRIQPFLLLLFLLCIHNASAQKVAEEKPKLFRDTLDNAVDLSEFLLTQKGFLLVPSIITEPAVGYGGAGTAMFFHSSFGERKGPPSISGVLGGGTENGTWMAGGFHFGVWGEDRFRYFGLLAKANVNINLYPLGRSKPLEFNMDSWLIIQKLIARIGNTNFFSGLRYLCYPTQNTLHLPISLPNWNKYEFESTLSEASVLFEYDSRNNIFSPQNGLYAQLSGTYSDTWLGGQDLYGRLGVTFLGFSALNRKTVLGIRLENNYSLGNAPFYALPIVNLRGVPLMKYQNTCTNVIETEISYNVYKRWYINAFSGIGNAFQDYSSFDKGKTARNLGVGFRYEIARLLGIKLGMDFALSNDDSAFYIVFGHAW